MALMQIWTFSIRGTAMYVKNTIKKTSLRKANASWTGFHIVPWPSWYSSFNANVGWKMREMYNAIWLISSICFATFAMKTNWLCFPKEKITLYLHTSFKHASLRKCKKAVQKIHLLTVFKLFNLCSADA